MKKFFLHIFIILAAVVLCDCVVKFIGRKAVLSLPDYGDSLICKPEYSLDRVCADILIVGSSRAEHHYDTKIIKNAFPKEWTIYNAGQHNQSVGYDYCVIANAVKRHKPKVIILDLESECLADKTTFSTSTMRPFAFRSSAAREVVRREGTVLSFLFNGFYSYNSTLLKILMDTKLPKTEDTLDGYAPLFGTVDTVATKDTRTIGRELIPDAETYLNDIILCCKENRIKLYIIFSPYIGVQTDNISKRRITQTALKYNIPVMDYENDSTFDRNSGLFYDRNHLNRKGSVIFSEKLCKVLKNY